MTVCAIDGCQKPRKHREWCGMHYERWRKYGDPFVVRQSPTRACSIEGCERKAQTRRGWCPMHYKRWRRKGDPTAVALTRSSCSVEGCDRPHNAHGFCGLHVRRWRIWGDPLYTGPSAEERFWAKVRKTDGCWEWTGAHTTFGYGSFSAAGEHVYAHRFSYELNVGQIPEGLHIDHLCCNPPCVNPAHLEPVTPKENVQRTIRRGRRRIRKAAA